MASDGKVVIDTELDGSGAESGMQKLGGTLGKVGGAAVGGVKAAVGAASAAIGGAAVAIGGLVTASVNAYASYEQLVGGVDTLFKDSSKKVQDYANNAYKTAGMSANQYMETVTGFSASLLQSLGGDTAKAAEYADSAIVDMSDNANKMGTDIEMITNAYGGFAKQNFTMLDNLKLGYGGTKEEMERLLEDAGKISGIKYDISSYADITQAIHVMQESMGIAGTTAKEASSTIQGSVSAMKSSWSNLLVGMADDSQDIQPLIDNFVTSVGTVMENIIPIATQAMGSITGMIETLLPILVEQIPVLIEQLLPTLLTAAASILGALAEGIVQNLPMLIDLAIGILQSLITGIVDNLPMIMESAISILLALVNGIITMLPMLLTVGLQALIQLALGIAQALPTLIPTIVQVVLSMVQILLQNLPLLIDAALQLMIGLAVGLINALPVLIEKAPEIMQDLTIAFIEAIPLILEAVVKLVYEMGKALIENSGELTKKIPELMKQVYDYFMEQVKDFADIGKNIVSGIWEGISGGWDKLIEDVKNLAKDLYESAKDALGIHSPSKKFEYIGKMSAAGMSVGFEKYDPVGEITAGLKASIGNVQISAAASQQSAATQSDSVTMNFWDTQTSPDAIYRKFNNTMTYGMARKFA